MASRPTEEFRAEAVRVALTSGLPRKQVAADFGIGLTCALTKAEIAIAADTMETDHQGVTDPTIGHCPTEIDTHRA